MTGLGAVLEAVLMLQRTTQLEREVFMVFPMPALLLAFAAAAFLSRRARVRLRALRFLRALGVS